MKKENSTREKNRDHEQDRGVVRKSERQQARTYVDPRGLNMNYIALRELSMYINAQMYINVH